MTLDIPHQETVFIYCLLSVFKQFDLQSVYYLAIMLVLIGCSGLISSAEVAFFSLSPAQLTFVNQKNAGRPFQVIRNLLANPKKLLATLLIANSLVNIGIVLISTSIVEHMFDFSGQETIGIVIQVVVVTLIIVLFGDVMPKVYATKKTLGMAYMMAYPVNILNKLLSPVSFILIVSTGIIDRKLKRKGYNLSMAELTHAIDISSDKDTPADEKKILKGIVKSGHIEVRQIMKPRKEVVALNLEIRLSEVINVINETGFSRMPVYKDRIDRITGVLYIKDLIKYLDESDDFKWQELIREPFFVPHTKKINDLLQEFQKKKIHLAVVVDEYGGTMGIATLEDILEEIVGDLADEFDDEEPIYSKLDEENYVFEGKTLLNDICRIMSIDRSVFDSIPGEKTTLANAIIQFAGKIPKKNEVIKFKNLRFNVEAADKSRIKRVKIFKSVAVHE